MNLLHLFPENWYKVIWGLGGDGGKVIIFITHWTAQKSSGAAQTAAPQNSAIQNCSAL